MIDKYLYMALAAVIWNITVFTLYGIDKYRASKHKWRISENTLILSAFLMGGIGALAGMQVFRHKTKHLRFKICVPLAVLLNIIVITFIYFSQRLH